MSTCTQKVLFTLAEKGASAELVTVDLSKGEHKQPAHVARQPFGKIPVLEDDGFSLYESVAIIRYLDEKLPGTKLTPADPKQRARMNQWISVEQSYVSGPALTLVMQLVWNRARGLEPNQAAVETARKDFDLALDVLNRGLAESPFLAGPELSLADICTLPYIEAMAGVGLLPSLDSRPHLARWHQQTAARPAWQNVKPQRR